MMRRATFLLLLLGAAAAPAQDQPAPAPVPKGKAERVVVLVWDGLRPDSVSETSTPTLFALSRQGVVFGHHHPVYPSSTEVNGAALATGTYPCHNGVLANFEYRPALDPATPVSTQSPEAVRKGDDLSGGRYLLVPTLAERVQQAGFPTVVAGTKGVALLHDRAEKGDASSDAARASVTLFEGKALPPAALDPIVAALGAFPPKITYPNLAQDAWTTQAVTGTLWAKAVPKLTLFWLSDPDFTQHDSAPGADPALQALRASDANLARVVNALSTRGLLQGTDLMIVSDHGFSTISRTVDVAAELQKGGFSAVRRFLPGHPAQPGDILVAGNGGTVYFYVANRDPVVTGRLVSFLQQSDFAGVILTRDLFAGAFPLARLNLDGPDAPDVAIAMRWTGEVNHFTVTGSVISDIGHSPGHGTHGTLSRFDMHNTLIASGPDFRRGWTDPLPSGNTDLAPTVAALLGLPAGPAMDGRVLSEAFVPDSGLAASSPPKLEEERLAATAPASGGTRPWSQYVVVKKVNGTVYFDEGNGAPVEGP
jgi:arylsulfatase A-like enzyme